MQQLAIGTAVENREQLNALKSELAARFWRNDPIEELMRELSTGTDALICALFAAQFDSDSEVALYAVGGYGRQELHPGSDIDLLLVAAKPARYQRAIELFMQSVFDLNIEVGHSVRTPKSCRDEARNDITVATALFERRFLTGDTQLVAKVDKYLQSSRLWPIDKFFAAKHEEQLQRHKHYDNIEYNLEPNVKTSPGGLRDIHTALWICNRQFSTTDPNRLVELDVLTNTEMRWLVEGQRFIWWVRFGLHLVAGRKEDHLQVSYQRELSQRLGFVDTDAQLGVERFMHHYYRHVLALREVNDILIQYFQEAVLKRRRAKIVKINERFQMHNNYIEATSPDTFTEQPAQMLEMFVLMANRTDIAGVRASTIRQIRENQHLIDQTFRDDPRHTQLFLELLKAPYTLVSQLTRMRRYGLLGRYIPEFGQIIGQMQHDMFHIYTVDAHTMEVIRNMRQFRYRSSFDKYPVAHHCVHNIPKIELLYIAGLFHDIGKGRGGDHSVLGSVDAEKFCQRHGLNEADTDLVCWLVKKHLYMSAVAQRQDIYDPDVVHKFAVEIKSEMRLDYLYALTAADINATNPTLWNNWRATLLHHLYMETRKALRRGLESPADKAATVHAYKERALEWLQERLPEKLADGADADRIQSVWHDLGDDFFLRHTPPQIAQFTGALLEHAASHCDATATPLVYMNNSQGDLNAQGATRIYVYAQDTQHLFATTVVTLAEFNVSVVDAVISTGPSGMCLDTYTVLDENGKALPSDSPLRVQIEARLVEVILHPQRMKKQPRRRVSRRQRDLVQATEVTIKSNPGRKSSTLTVLASDRPGLLATIGRMFIELELHLLSAKITTLGERVEDTFVIQTSAGKAVAAGQTGYELTHTIRQRIDQHLQSQ
ncbi:MAG: [protein-PII] uridylyltransferase [Pseudomonadota bacterium]